MLFLYQNTKHFTNFIQHGKGDIPYFSTAYCCAHLMQKKMTFLSTSYLNLASSSTLAGSWAAWMRLGISGVAFRGVLGVPGKGCKEK